MKARKVLPKGELLVKKTSSYGAKLSILLAVSGTCCFAQSTSFGLSSGSGGPGSTVTLNIAMNTISGTAPASVQWTLNYSAVDFSSVTVSAGSVASGAGKTIDCVAATGSETCVLWGENSTAMNNGVVATVAMVISGSTQDTSSQVQLAVPVVSDPSGFALAATATGGTVTISQPAALSGFSCVPATLTPPATSTCTLNLTAGAPGGGASIVLSASPQDVNMPSSVSISQGGSSGTFTVTPLAVTTPTPIDLAASYLGVQEGFGLTVDPVPTLTGISVSPTILGGELSISGIVTLSAAAGTGGVTIGLSSSDTLAALVPASVTIPQGSASATFSLVTIDVLFPVSVVLTASYSGVNVTQDLSILVRIHPLIGLSISPGEIQSGQQANGTVTLKAPAGAGGVQVQLFSSNPSVVGVPDEVTVAAGATSASFTAYAGNTTNDTNVAIIAYLAGLEQTANLAVDALPTAETRP